MEGSTKRQGKAMTGEAPATIITGDGYEGGGLRACRGDIGMEEGRPTYVEKETRAGEAHTSTGDG